MNYEFSDGANECFKTVVTTCKCKTCKNFWWVPSDGKFGEASNLSRHLRPGFCPFCGREMDLNQAPSMTEEELAEMQDILQPDDE